MYSKNSFPVQRVGQIGKGLVAGVRAADRGREGSRSLAPVRRFGSQTVVEKFFIGAPPEGVVDHGGSAERGVLQVSTVKRHILGDAIDDHGIIGWFTLHYFVDMDGLGDDARDVLAVDRFDKGHRKASFLAEQYAYFFHVVIYSRSFLKC